MSATLWQRYWASLLGRPAPRRLAGCDQEPVPHEHYTCCDHCLTGRPELTGPCMFRNLHHDPCARCQ